MFNVDDYPHWVDKLFCDLGCSGSDLEQEVWTCVRQEAEPPHIGNAIVTFLFYKIEQKITQLTGGVELEIDKYVNGLDSHLTVNGICVNDIETVLKIIEDFKVAA